MKISCPQCGTEYEVERKYLHHHTTCHACGTNFLIDSPNHPACKPFLGEAACPQLVAKKVCGSFNLKANLPLWFKMCFYNWKLKHAVCPVCKAETVVLVPTNGACAFRCDSCGRTFNLVEGLAKSNETYQVMQTKCEAIQNQAAREFADIDDQLVSIRRDLKIYEEREKFYEQVEIFEYDWEAYTDKILPERLKFTVESLRARLSTAQSSVVANSVAQAEATNQTYGTTVGLRDSDNALDGLVRGIVQIGGWAKMMDAERERRQLDDSIEEIQSSLDHAESMMRYYFDLCDEFKGKDKESARRDRLQARCNCDSEDSLPVVDCGKSEDTLLSEKKALERQRRKLENSAKDQINRIHAAQNNRNALRENAKNRLWRSLFLAFLAVGALGTAVTLGGCYIHDALADADRRRIEAKRWKEEEEKRRAKEAEDERRMKEFIEKRHAKEIEERRHRIEEEKRQRLAKEKAARERIIEELFGVEAEIEERKASVNSILYGKKGGDWTGFDANKVVATDTSVSILGEPPQKRVAENLSEKDSLATIDKALFAAQKEASRLEERLKELARVKDVYIAKELESRKETCAPCGGIGSIGCARCKGKGEVVSADRVPCPTCSVGDSEDDFSSGDLKRKGQIKRQVNCGNCRGTGQVQKKCGSCNGRKKVAVEEPGRMRRYERCSACNGSGYDYPETCPKCNGDKKLEVWQTCTTCKGRGEVINSGKVTCPVCDGKGKLKCERCDGRGFTYRPKR